MKKNGRIVYPSVYTYEPEQENAVVFPDLNDASSGANDEEVLYLARQLPDPLELKTGQ